MFEHEQEVDKEVDEGIVDWIETALNFVVCALAIVALIKYIWS